MRFTRRIPDRHLTSALAAAGVMAALCAMASCSSSDDPPVDPGADAAPDGATLPDTGPPTVDAGADSPPDAGPFDGAAPTIVCESPSCAISLSTTRGQFSKDFTEQYIEDPAEGFCALLRDGTVACWGANGNGQLGRGSDVTAPESVTPERVTGVSNVVALDHTCALDNLGKVRCWGRGPFLRDEQGGVTVEASPVELPLPPVARISVGFETGCAIVDGGSRLSCWGANGGGQIDPDLSLGVLPARDIVLPPGAPLRDVVVGSSTFVIRQDGTALSWGNNPPLGRMSTLFPDPYPQPLDLSGIFVLDLAHQDACAIVGGIGHCWGMSAPRSFADLGKPLIRRALPEPIVAPEPIRQIATTDTTVETFEFRARPSRWCACGVSGAVYCFGANANGQAGDGTKEYALEAVKVNLPSPAVEVKVAPTATCALLTTGKVFCWGSNFSGQLGFGKLKEPSLVPKEVVLP